ncbi:hypothetical protein SKAU_G00051930 [Synaphobranchus kaupii]|uniref:Uncharacterized protein n=1 Tax=Synaphobranchus kaupii TaxID=118154 RepID=A0A9Q1J9I9_SYNKA|nr:hypothetical protein SKAU_G00051930 [Synaphobranchus kaupii]
MLVRSMSTSRRHSWEAPLSPMEPGRRLSLDTTAMDSDGEGDEDSLLQSSNGLLHKSFTWTECSSDSMGTRTGETDLSHCKPKETELELNVSGRSLYSRSDIVASEESRAARLSLVLETSKQAAAAAGEEPDLENLQTAEGKCHMLMVQKVLRELKHYHGAKQRTECREEKVSTGNVTWYEFLSKENEEEEDRTDKVEKGTKVKRTLSSLKNRMTGSFTKDKGKSREPQKEKGKEREKEREPKERKKLRRASSTGHQLVPGIFSSLATCSLCSKTLQRKHGMQCVSEYCCRTATPSHASLARFRPAPLSLAHLQHG